MNAIKKEVEITYEEFNNYLDKELGVINICGVTYLTSTVWVQIDPTAYHCAFDDYEDAKQQDRDEIWICSACNEEHNNQDDAEECCNEN